jgi:hypothetical protein
MSLHSRCSGCVGQGRFGAATPGRSVFLRPYRRGAVTLSDQQGVWVNPPPRTAASCRVCVAVCLRLRPLPGRSDRNRFSLSRRYPRCVGQGRLAGPLFCAPRRLSCGPLRRGTATCVNPAPRTAVSCLAFASEPRLGHRRCSRRQFPHSTPPTPAISLGRFSSASAAPVDCLGLITNHVRKAVLGRYRLGVNVASASG